jgi:hypothetical protein
MSSEKPALRLVLGSLGEAAQWSWFCGHCASRSPCDEPPPPAARVCSACGLGLLIEAREDVVPGARDAYLVVDASLMVQGMSHHAEKLLAVPEDAAVNRPVVELLVPADAEARGPASFAGAVAEAVGGGDEPVQTFVRPWNTFGVRMRARIAPCGPPRAALLVLETSPSRLRAVETR